MTSVAFVGTQSFWDNTNLLSGNPAHDAINYTEAAWNDYIDNGSYDLRADIFTEGTVSIPYSALPTSGVLKDHLREAENWLNNNWYGTYTQYDTVHILDWWGGDQGMYGWAWIGAAGEFRKASLSDFYWEWAGMGNLFRNVKMDGVVLHEVLHTYCARHVDAAVGNGCSASIMHSPGANEGPECFQDCSPIDIIGTWTSPCTEDVVRCFIDGGLDPGNCNPCY